MSTKCPGCGKDAPVVKRIGMPYSVDRSDVSFRMNNANEKYPVSVWMYGKGYGKTKISMLVGGDEDFGDNWEYETIIPKTFDKVTNADLRKATLWALTRATYDIGEVGKYHLDEKKRNSIVAELEKIKKRVPTTDFVRREEGHGTEIG